ncbi:hypothetical protein [Maribacter sp. 2308TA10-17]|uniref:hypothetical protein n=1 Tax=Maribacter sp. 2308TA10-17 TaxID=3386276 RepID=UPI0039BD7473
MMKSKYYLGILVLMIISGCSAQQVPNEIKITYLASSRGLYKDIELSKQKISVLENRSSENRTEVEMPKDEWEALLKRCQALPAQTESFDSEKLSIDAAIGSTLTIKGIDDSKDMVFKIDYSNVPELFEPLISQILALSETVE